MSDNESIVDNIYINHIGVIINVIEQLVLVEKYPLDKIAELFEVDDSISQEEPTSYIQRELIKHLYKKGYYIEKIAKDLSIAKDDVQQIIDTSGIKIADPSNLFRFLKPRYEMDVIRYNYYQRYFVFDMEFSKYRLLNLVQADKKVSQAIQKIKEKYDKFLSTEGTTAKDKLVTSIYDLLISIKNYKITIENCTGVIDVINEIRNKLPEDSKSKEKLDASEKIIVRQLLVGLVGSINRVRSLEDLEAIYQMVVGRTVDSDDFKRIVELMGQKIEAAKRNNEASEIIYHIPPQMHNAICGLLDGSLSVNEIRAIIHYKDPQNDGIGNMIKILSERSDIYQINPQMYTTLMERVIELVDGDEAQVSLFRCMIIENLCQRGKCKTARELIKKTICLGNDIADDKKDEVVKELQEIVLYREIGELVLKTIIEKKSNKNDWEILQTLKQRLPQDYTQEFMKKVSLGKDQFGIESINLGQVMKPKEKRKTLHKEESVPRTKKTKAIPATKEDMVRSATDKELGEEPVPIKAPKVTPIAKVRNPHRKSPKVTPRPYAVHTSVSGKVEKSTNISSGRKTPIEILRESYFRRCESLGLDSKQYKRGNYEENPIKVADLLLRIEELNNLYRITNDKQKIIQEINNKVQSLLGYRISFRECVTIIKTLGDLDEASKVSNCEIKQNIKSVLSRVGYEAIQSLQQVNSDEEVEEILNGLESVINIDPSRELRLLTDQIGRRLSNCRYYYINYRITHDISPSMDKVIKGFLDGSMTAEEIKKEILPQEEINSDVYNSEEIAYKLQNALRAFRKIITERGDKYPIDYNRVPELLEQYLALFDKDNNKLVFAIMVVTNLCKQGEYDKAICAIDGMKIERIILDSNGQIIKKRNLSEEDVKFNKDVEKLKYSSVLAIKVRRGLQRLILNPVSPTEDELAYRELKKEVYSSKGFNELSGKDYFWNNILFGNDKLGTKITIGLLEREARSIE